MSTNKNKSKRILSRYSTVDPRTNQVTKVKTVTKGSKVKKIVKKTYSDGSMVRKEVIKPGKALKKITSKYGSTPTRVKKGDSLKMPIRKPGMNKTMGYQ